MQQIVLSPLEIMLGGAILSLLVALATHIVTRGAYVSRDLCNQRHGNVCKFMEGIKTSNDRQYRMLRGLIVHSDMPSDVQERLINDRGGEQPPAT